LACAGMFLGTMIALVVAKIIASLLFATSPWDLATYLGMVIALLLVAAVSGYIPARRASAINPTEALRSN
jgi:ABC-type antimicrobial peptide transport system permease subunit